jgi:hypothetical protein
MDELVNDSDNKYRAFEKCRYRYRKVYWLAIPPILAVIGIGFWVGNAIAGLMIVMVGLIVTFLVIMRDAVDMLGYVRSMQLEMVRREDAVRQEIATLQTLVAANRCMFQRDRAGNQCSE